MLHYRQQLKYKGKVKLYANMQLSTAMLISSLYSLYIWHLFLLHRQDCSQLQILNKHTKRMQLSVYGGQEHSFGLEGLYYFFLIFCLRFLCNIYYRYSVFLKLRKILIQQQRSNNIVILEAKHAKFRNKLCHYKRRLCHTQNNNWLWQVLIKMWTFPEFEYPFSINYIIMFP